MLRKELTNHLPHLRVLTVSHRDFFKDVVCSRLLTGAEVIEVCLFHGNKDHKPELNEICDITESRTKPPLYKMVCSTSLDISCNFHYLKQTVPSQNCTIRISKLKYAIELTSLSIYIYNSSNFMQGNYAVKIDQVDSDSPGYQLSVTVPSLNNSYFLFQNFRTLVFPVPSNDTEDIILHPDSEYNVTLSSFTPLDVFYSTVHSSSVKGSHFDVSFSAVDGKYVSCVRHIYYKQLEPAWIPFSVSDQ